MQRIKCFLMPEQVDMIVAQKDDRRYGYNWCIAQNKISQEENYDELVAIFDLHVKSNEWLQDREKTFFHVGIKEACDMLRAGGNNNMKRNKKSQPMSKKRDRYIPMRCNFVPKFSTEDEIELPNFGIVRCDEKLEPSVIRQATSYEFEDVTKDTKAPPNERRYNLLLF